MDDYDYLDEEYDEEDYDYDPAIYSKSIYRPSLITLYKECIYPAIFGESFTLISHIVVLCLVQRIIVNLVFLPKWTSSLSSLSFGILLLSRHLPGLPVIILMCYSVFGVILLTLASNSPKLRVRIGLLTVLLSSITMISCQIFLPAQSFTQLRGALMISIMKLCSVAFDLQNSTLQYPLNVITLYAYMLDVSSVLFGPWFSYNQFALMLSPKDSQSNLFSMLFGMLKLVIALLFLLHSQCCLVWLLPDQMEYYSKWIIAFRDAQSFRFSHYFVSTLSESSLLLAGMDHQINYIVTKPFQIEVPRSLVDVVVSWNVPMHTWLKIYVFRQAKPLGNFAAILLTYAASSLLHGLNFQLSAILLSLGVYTYAEHVIRDKLSRIYDACIGSRKCKNDENNQCGHIYNKFHPLVMAANVLFLLLAMFHLAYLGMVFDGSEYQETGYSCRHTIESWASLNFMSHWIALVTLFFAKAI